jgi:hypothetical protein
MKPLFLTLALATLCAVTGYGQTIKSLGYTTNGQIVAATNVVWTNAFSFSTNTAAAEVRTNLQLGATWLTNDNVTNFRTAIGLGATNDVVFDQLQLTSDLIISDGGIISFEDTGEIQFGNAAGPTRTNLGIPLPALTNTNAQNLLDALGVTGGDALVPGIQVDRAKVLWDSADDDWGFRAEDGFWKTQPVFTTTNAPTNTNAAIWISVEIGTNFYKLPLFQ